VHFFIEALLTNALASTLIALGRGDEHASFLYHRNLRKEYISVHGLPGRDCYLLETQLPHYDIILMWNGHRI